MPRLKVRQACGSRSTRRTRWPCSARAAPSEATVVVLATPPFWLATATTWVRWHHGTLCRTHGVSARGSPTTAPSRRVDVSELRRLTRPGADRRTASRAPPGRTRHVGEQPVVVQQQRRRTPAASPARASGRRPPRRRRRGRAPRRRVSWATVSVSSARVRRRVVDQPHRHGPASGAHVDGGRAVADLRPGVVVRRAGAAGAEPDAGVLRDDGDLDLAVEVAGARPSMVTVARTRPGSPTQPKSAIDQPGLIGHGR